MTDLAADSASPFKEATDVPTSPTSNQEAPPSPVSPPRSAPRQVYFPPLPSAPPYYNNGSYPTFTAGPFAATSHIHDYGRSAYTEEGGFPSAPMRYEGFGDRARLPTHSPQQRSLSLSPTFAHATVHPAHAMHDGDNGGRGPRMPAPLKLEQVRRIPAMSASPASACIHPSAAEGGHAQPAAQYAERQVSMDAMSGDEPPNSAASFTSAASVDSDATATGGEGGGASPFISKLQHLLSCDKYRPYIRWNNAGDAFILSHTNQHFAQEVLPMLFRHSNTSSFIRQLNMYDFTRLPVLQLLEMIDDSSNFDSRVSTSCFSGFSHPYLRRDQPELGKRIKPKVSRSHANRKASAAARKAAQIASGVKPTRSHPYAGVPHTGGIRRMAAVAAAARVADGEGDDGDPDYVA